MVRTGILCATGLLAALSAVSARADSCDSATTQADMTACYDATLKGADKKLNAVYREIESRLGDDPDTRKLLVAAERAWIGFRDAECAFSASGGEGGSAYPMTVSMCLADLTAARTKQLSAFLDCGEGDMSCPVPGK